jgi:hypothetical protein
MFTNMAGFLLSQAIASDSIEARDNTVIFGGI